jgi:hypothetical protein
MHADCLHPGLRTDGGAVGQSGLRRGNRLPVLAELHDVTSRVRGECGVKICDKSIGVKRERDTGTQGTGRELDSFFQTPGTDYSAGVGRLHSMRFRGCPVETEAAEQRGKFGCGFLSSKGHFFSLCLRHFVPLLLAKLRLSFIFPPQRVRVRIIA